MEYQALKKLVQDTAVELARRGSGWSQESVVLREIADRLRPGGRLDLPTQQVILRAWHELFRDGSLSWGYNLNNPSWPFFHVPADVPEGEPVTFATG